MLEMGARNPVGRIVSPEDVAACVTFLCSPEAEMIRGQTLVVDGLVAARGSYERMNPWRAAETSATASGNSTRMASRSASACASDRPST